MNVNHADSYGETPLLVAAAQGHVDVVRLLIAASANVNARTRSGTTPLHHASGQGRLAVAEQLIQAGASPVAKDDMGWTPLEWAKNGSPIFDKANSGLKLKRPPFFIHEGQEGRCAEVYAYLNRVMSSGTFGSVVVGTPTAPSERTQAKGIAPVTVERRTEYNNAGISFEYPTTWRSFPAQAVSGMRTTMVSKLGKYNRTLISLDMFISPDEEVAFFVSKVQAHDQLSVEDILSERRRFYDDATRAGDVTKVNKLEATTLNQFPAVVEDVERSNGGRGHTVKVLKGGFIVELSLVVNNKANYEGHTAEYNKILATLAIRE